MTTLQAKAVGVLDDADTGTFVLAFAEETDGSGEHLELQRAHAFDEQDRQLGMATYCLVNELGVTHYGGLDACVLAGRNLRLEFSPEAADAFEVTGYEIVLPPDADLELVSASLQRIFADLDAPPQRLLLST